MRLVVIAMAGLLALVAPARAQDSSHCDKLTNDDAFNKCLAAASPAKAGARAPRSAAPVEDASSAEKPAARSTRRGRGAYVYRRGRSYGRAAQARPFEVQRLKNGRVRMSLPGPARRR